MSGFDLGSAFPPIIVIAGPTAVGKTAASLDLASRFDAEIVSADSRQVYRRLDIGTAKPSRAEREAVPHHIVDVVEPDEPYSAARFRDDADWVLVDIKRRGRVAFLAGGTGHYIQAVLDRLEIPKVLPQERFRREMEEFARAFGHQALHDRLREVDPAGAAEIQATNVRRVVRALEVQKVTGVPFSEIGRRRGDPIPALYLALTTDRETLYRRIDERVEQQIRDGLFDETKLALEAGFDPARPALTGLVYREAVAVVQGRMRVAEAAKRMKEANHAYARRQYTWFRRVPGLRWLESGPTVAREMEEAIREYLGTLGE